MSKTINIRPRIGRSVPAGGELVVTPHSDAAVVKAMRAVLPSHVRLLPVGGITPDHMGAYVQAGANGFGPGSALYAPRTPAADVAGRARRFVAAWRALSVASA